MCFLYLRVILGLVGIVIVAGSIVSLFFDVFGKDVDGYFLPSVMLLVASCIPLGVVFAKIFSKLKRRL